MNRTHSSPQPVRIGALVEGLLADRGLLAACKEQEVVQKWAEVVGPDVAAVTECSRAENGVLYVKVATAAWRHELAYMKHIIVGKMRDRFGSVVNDIVFH